MPEGDTVFRTCARLHEALAGRVLLAAELRWPSLSTADLTGMTVTEVVPRGKHILTRFDSGWTLHSHLKMEGQWRISRTGADSSARDRRGSGRRERTRAGGSADDVRAILVTDPWTATGLRLGQLDVVRTAEEDALVGHLGPDLLGPGWGSDRAVANLESSREPIGAALLDQRNLAGLGTMWTSETLFLERTSPWSTSLATEQLTRIVDRAHRLVTAAVSAPIQTSTGLRREGENTYVHARSGRPCRRCGTTIRVMPIGPPTRERAMFYCPTCQGGLAPGDAGHPIAPLGAAGR